MSEPTDSNTKDAGLYFRLFTEVGIINQLSSNRAERCLPHGLTMSQFSVLNHFARGLPPKSPLELANAFQVTKGAMTNTLKQLGNKGFVKVVGNEEDKRAKIVSISEEGLSAFADAQKSLMIAFSDFVSAMDEQDIANLLPGLEAVRVWLDENRK